MKKRIKYILIISFLLFLVFGIVNSYMNARDRELEIERRDKEKEDKRNSYIITRDNNLYTLKSAMLVGKNLKNIFYDGVCVYMLYTDSLSGTLLKYSASEKETVVIFENNPLLKDGIIKIGNYYKIGDRLYDSNFEKSIDYPTVNEGEVLYPDLSKVYYNREDGVYERELDTNSETAIAINNDTSKYSLYKITDNGYVLLNREENDKKYIDVLDKDSNTLSEYETLKDKDESFDIIYDKYLLKTTNSDSRTLYKIYDITNSSNIYTSSSDNDHLLFQNTKFVANKNGDIILNDYINSEERVLISHNTNKARWFPKTFILASDNYSLLLMLDNNDRKFYLIYL